MKQEGLKVLTVQISKIKDQMENLSQHGCIKGKSEDRVDKNQRKSVRKSKEMVSCSI